jgi:hypothetical protein
MALAVKMATFYRVLEYWSVGVLAKAKTSIFKLNFSFQSSITPLLHHSSKLTQEGKDHSNPSEVNLKPDLSNLYF